MKSRWTISALGAFFVAIALVVSGCGSNDGVASNSVAAVGGNQITKQMLDHWLYVDEKSQSASAPGQPVIVPNDPPKFDNCVSQVRKDFTQYKKTPAATIQGLCGKLFNELNTTVLGFLIESYQYQALAHRLGINVTPAQAQKQLDKEIKQQFKTKAEYTQYLKESGYTNEDVLYRTRIVAIYKKLAARHTTKVTPQAISDYYNAHKSTFGTPETRDMRIVLAKTQSQASAALSALKGGQSWNVVAKKYSTDPTTKNNGGQLTGVTKGQQDAALSNAAFSAPVNKLEGPIKGQFGYYVVEVTKITPATQQSLKQATPQIKSTLTTQSQQKAEKAVNAEAKSAFGSRTLCAKYYGVSLCHNYKDTKIQTSTSTATSSATGTATTGSGGSSGSSGSGSGSTKTSSTKSGSASATVTTKSSK
jgi:foldase protein PrsA